MNLPPPAGAALEHQKVLLGHLAKLCLQQNGYLTFVDFMNQALYAPGLGYYSAGLTKLGAQGDFVTAPEISALFSRCLGAQCDDILKNLPSSAIILELGAGSGKMAADILIYLQQQNTLPQQYWILEISADLKQRQQTYLKTQCPDFYHRIIWLAQLPSEPFVGIILGNEVLDAMPVHLFQVGENEAVLEGYVGHIENQWQLVFKPTVNQNLITAVKDLQNTLDEPLPLGYTSEINLLLSPWLKSLAACLQEGVFLFLDYGFSAHEYYHSSRHMGTLMCHYQHYAHSDPLQLIGLQDITAHVDFTALAMAAMRCQLEIAGYTQQAPFLIANGLLELGQAENLNSQQQLLYSQQIQKLTHPHEMGELFKVMALSKNYARELKGFSLIDRRNRL